MPDPAIDHRGHADITRAIEDRTDSLVIERLLIKKGMPVSLLGKMKALTESAEDFNKSTSDVLDGIADKIRFAKIKRDAAAEKHHGYYDGIIEGVEDSVKVIDRLSNLPLGKDGEG
jgi:hypothetical protein